ncbi:Gfo/Idh/MocA family oxidoreductase [Rubripirellula sp.]|nr:Gfo/Idh/MocA family oxidoreductase [Rubripirellula sp.]
MNVRFAFAGFRHPHIFDMYQRCRDREDVEIVACCEEDAATREELGARDDLEITHTSCDAMLDQVECDVVAVGDSYGLRANRILAALQRGRHVISDKPVCTSLAELDQIEAAAQANGRIVGCMLDMRDLPVFLGLRDLIRNGEIGEVQAISFDGQHPLNYGKRPMWYFEPGMHGGVINDIAVHAIDFIPWATGQEISELTAARGWNATAPQHPDFQQCGQGMLSLENGAGVIFDVSYLTPDSIGYTMPIYWRFTIWGTDGALEAGFNTPQMTLFKNGEDSPRSIELPVGKPGAYLESFLHEIGGETDLHLSSADVMKASRISLQLQEIADRAK